MWALLSLMVGAVCGQSWDQRRWAAETAGKFDLATLQLQGQIKAGQDNHIGCCVWQLESAEQTDQCERNPFFMKSICQHTCGVLNCPFGSDVDFDEQCNSVLGLKSAAIAQCSRIQASSTKVRPTPPVTAIRDDFPTPQPVLISSKPATSNSDSASPSLAPKQGKAAPYGAHPPPPPPPPPPTDPANLDYQQFDNIDPTGDVLYLSDEQGGIRGRKVIRLRKKTSVTGTFAQVPKDRKRLSVGWCEAPSKEDHNCPFMASQFRKPGSRFVDTVGQTWKFPNGICLHPDFLQVCPCACAVQMRRRIRRARLTRRNNTN